MTFLSLGPALVAAAFAVPALLALYVLKLRRRSLRTSTIAFWQAASADAQANVPFQKLRPSWMLALHLGVLACLLVAFARPVLESNGGVGPARTVLLIDASASMQARDSLDGLIPTQQTLTRLDRAKTRAKEIVREVRRASNAPAIAVVVVGAQSETVLGFSSSGPMLEAAIDAIEPTDQPGDLVGALRLAESLATQASSDAKGDGTSDAGAEGEQSARANAKDEAIRAAAMRASVSVVLLSDGSFEAMPQQPGGMQGTQQGVAAGASPAQPERADTGLLVPGPVADTTATSKTVVPLVPLRFERIGPPLTVPAVQGAATVEALNGSASRNVGVSRIAAQRDAKVPSKVRLLIALVNNGPQEAAITLTVALDGAVKQRTATVVPRAVLPVAAVEADRQADEAGDGGDVSRDAEPATKPAAQRAGSQASEPRPTKAVGEQELVIDVANVDSGLLSVVLDVGTAADAIASDNSASIMLLAQRAPSIVVLRSQVAAGSANTLRFLLMDVLEELRPARLEERVLPTGAGEKEVSEQLRLDGAWADVAILDDLSLAGLPPMPVIVLGGDAPALGVSRTGDAAMWSGLVFWDRQHPLLQGVGLDSLVLSKRLPLQLPQRDAATGSAQSPWRHDVLARDGDDPLIVLAQPRALADGAGVRHMVTGFTLMESNWPLSPSFAIFLANAVDSLSLRDAARVGKALTTATSGQVRVPASGVVKLIGPIERELRASDDDEAAVGALRASAPVLVSTGVLARAGVYRLEFGARGGTAANAQSSDQQLSDQGIREQTTIDQTIIDQTNINQSAIDQSIERLVAVNVVNEHESAAASPKELRFDGQRVSQQAGGTSQRELWPPLLIIALALLTIEWVVFARQTRA